MYKENIMNYKYIKSNNDFHGIIQELATFDFNNFNFTAFYLDKDQSTHQQLKVEDISLDVDNRKFGTNDVLNNMQDCQMMSFNPSKYFNSPSSGIQIDLSSSIISLLWINLLHSN